eukprot:scaffold11101_cov28-Tisochrysis_lutea.AAC.1
MHKLTQKRPSARPLPPLHQCGSSANVNDRVARGTNRGRGHRERGSCLPPKITHTLLTLAGIWTEKLCAT